MVAENKKHPLEPLLQRARERLQIMKTYSTGTPTDIAADKEMTAMITNLEKAIAVEMTVGDTRADTLEALAVAQYIHHTTITAAMELVIALI